MKEDEKMSAMWKTVGVVVLIAIVLSGCDENIGSDIGRNVGEAISCIKTMKAAINNPPISASFRWSYLGRGSGSVLTVTNLSAQKGVVVKIYRNETGKYTQRFFIKASDEKEFGELQIGANFFNGQTGYVMVEGFPRKLYFKCGDEDYQTWFGD